MEEIIRKLLAFTQDPCGSLAKWKKHNGKKVIGLTPMYFPEEIIHASGMLPVEMWSSNEPITVAYAHLTPYYCGLTRSIVDDLIKGNLDFLDGVVTYETCIQARTISLIIEKNCHIPFLQTLFLPNQMLNPLTRPYLLETLDTFKSCLEEFVGHGITKEALSKSISIYNKNRKLLRQIYELRKESPGVISLREMCAIVWSSMLMLKEEHNALLEELILELKERPKVSDICPKIVLVGSLCTAPSSEILRLLDDSGLVVVDDDMYVGSKYFSNDVGLNRDPIEALADRFLARTPPCPTMVDSETDWGDYIIEIVKKSGVQGVITLIQKNCPPHMCYAPDVMRKLSHARIPELLIEVEHEAVNLEQMRTRVEAFKEMLGDL